MRKVKHPCLPKWRARVEKALERGYFIGKDVIDAENWNHCAFAEARARYSVPVVKGKYSKQNAPKDTTLEHLGYDFASAVHNGSIAENSMFSFEAPEHERITNINEANVILDKIERRLTRMMAKL